MGFRTAEPLSPIHIHTTVANNCSKSLNKNYVSLPTEGISEGRQSLPAQVILSPLFLLFQLDIRLSVGAETVPQIQHCTSVYPTYRLLCFPDLYFVSQTYRVQVKTKNAKKDFNYPIRIMIVNLFLPYFKAKDPPTPLPRLVLVRCRTLDSSCLRRKYLEWHGCIAVRSWQCHLVML